MATMGWRLITPRALQVALGLEVAWALFLAYEIHHHSGGGLGIGGWQLQVLSFISEWASPAVAIVVVTLLAELVLAQHRRPQA